MGAAEVTVEMQRLSPADHEAIERAVAQGRAVEEEHLRAPAAEWAIARRRQAALVRFGIIGPLGLLSLAVIAWLADPGPDANSWAVAIGGCAVFGTVSLLIWRLVWRPLVRAEKANSATGGAVAPPPTSVASDWLQAWAIAVLLTLVIGLMLDPPVREIGRSPELVPPAQWPALSQRS